VIRPADVPAGPPTESAIAELPEVLTPPQAAWLLQLSLTQLARAARSGAIPSTRIGRSRRFRKSVLLSLVSGGS
jgi:excisionase family DNA binding protein